RDHQARAAQIEFDGDVAGNDVTGVFRQDVGRDRLEASRFPRVVVTLDHILLARSSAHGDTDARTVQWSDIDAGILERHASCRYRELRAASHALRFPRADVSRRIEILYLGSDMRGKAGAIEGFDRADTVRACSQVLPKRCSPCSNRRDQP